jgi:cytoskeletal protein CcmA (bactofilin family)
MNKKLTKFILIAAAILMPIIGFAATKNNSDSIFVASDETITGNLMAAAESVVIDGTISGDLIAAGSSITVNGRIEGDIIAIAQSIVINGEVGGNVRIIGNYININGLIARNLNAFGSEVLVGENTKVGWDVLIGAVSARTSGNIGGSIDAYVQKIFINGRIGKNVNVKIYKNNSLDNLVIDKAAIINGDLNYSSDRQLALQESNVAGQINFRQTESKEGNALAIWAWSRVFSILSMILLGLILVFALPKQVNNIIELTKKKYLKSTLIGMIVLMIIPVLSFLLLFTIIGIPLSLVLMCLWLAGIFIAKTLAALMVGDLIIKDVLKNKNAHLFWSLLLGVLILSLLFSLPWFGWLLRIITIFLALGSILIYVTNKSKNI